MADYLRSLMDRLPADDQAEVVSLMAATTESERREAAYMAALPGRMASLEDMVSDLLPEGLRFEWGPADA